MYRTQNYAYRKQTQGLQNALGGRFYVLVVPPGKRRNAVSLTNTVSLPALTLKILNPG